MTITRRYALFATPALIGTTLLRSRKAFAETRMASLAYGPATAVYALGGITEAKGYFKEENLDLSLIIGSAGTHGRQTLAAGQCLFAHGDASHPLQLSARGKKAKIILATQMASSISHIVVRKDLFDAGIDSVEKLAAYKRPDGTKPIVAATAIGSGTWMYGTYVFEAKGLGNHVTWVAGGGLNTMLPGLQTKQFDAIMAVPGWALEAESKGFGKVIFNPSNPQVAAKTFGGTLPVLVLYTLQDTIDQNRETVQAFVNAMYHGMKWLKSAPLDEAYKLVGERYFRGQDEALVKAELGFDPVTWAYDGRIDKASFERGGKVWYRHGTDIPQTAYEDAVDMSFLDVAHKKYA